MSMSLSSHVCGNLFDQKHLLLFTLFRIPLLKNFCCCLVSRSILSAPDEETMAGHLIERIIREGQCSASCDIKAGRQGVPGHCLLDTSTASCVVQPVPR